MNRLNVATQGICSWRERLANPERQWRRRYSAFEAAVSWENAATTESGLPEPIRALLDCVFGTPKLLLAVAEHKVRLPGGNADSQNDVWGLVETAAGLVSLSVEAKARETFGNKTLAAWLEAGAIAEAHANRQERWNYIRNHLPDAADGAYLQVAYQILHRCASAVIEARRFGLKHAACIIQAFNTPQNRFDEFSQFSQAIGLNVPQGSIQTIPVGDIVLAIGWAECLFATDQQIAAIT